MEKKYLKPVMNNGRLLLINTIPLNDGKNNRYQVYIFELNKIRKLGMNYIMMRKLNPDVVIAFDMPSYMKIVGTLVTRKQAILKNLVMI
jgi:hypothetical protein